MTIHKALDPRDDVDRLYGSRKEEGRGLASIVDFLIQRLEDYIERCRGRLQSTETIRTIRESIEEK